MQIMIVTVKPMNNGAKALSGLSICNLPSVKKSELPAKMSKRIRQKQPEQLTPPTIPRRLG
jgi:hypothetical protein